MLHDVPLWKAFFVAISILLTSFNVGFYIFSVFRRGVRPHLFSWIIWSLVPLVVAIAQLLEGGGIGAWPTLYSAAISVLVVIVAALKGETHATKGDWISLAGCGFAVTLWVMTSNPLWSVLLVSTIDIVGFYPSVRKSWDKPHEESVPGYMFFGLRQITAMAGLQNYNVMTVFYPFSMMIACFGFAAFLVIRRQKEAD